MTLSLLVTAALAYLVLLFLVAYLADRGGAPASLRHHPLVYALSLGVYASSWTYYGSVGFARREGFSFLTIYLGPTLACLAIPIIWLPILRLTREHQLTSVADLFAFRYRSQLAGVLVTLVMLTGSVPYLALQFRALLESLRVLSGDQAPLYIGLGFTLVLTLFAVLFGARRASPRERHDGLLFAIALESLVKLAALLVVGAVAFFTVLKGASGLRHYLEQHADAVPSLYRPVRQGPWGTYLLLSFSAAFLVPRQFHVAFAEHVDDQALTQARVTFPLFLLLLNLAVVPILWAGTQLAPTGNADFYVLDVSRASGSSLLTILAFVGGISAGSAMVIVTTVALASMCMNHLILPLYLPPRAHNVYRMLAWMRRATTALIILAGYGFYRLVLNRPNPLADLGLISFVTVAQCLPGLVGVLFWRRATRLGLSLGLLVGFVVWVATLVLPLFGAPRAAAWWHLVGADEPFFPATFISLLANSLTFVTVSLLGRPSDEEREAARICCGELALASTAAALASPAELRARLALLLGEAVAERETTHALADLGMAATETRPRELRRLRLALERNLSALFGPLIARLIVDEAYRVDGVAAPGLGDRLSSLEEQLRALPSPLEGTASELALLWRYLRDVLEDLPLGVCALGTDGTIVIWNSALTSLAEIKSASVRGFTLARIGEPWAGLFTRFLATDEHSTQATVRVGMRTRALQLSKSRLSAGAQPGGWVLLVEDRTAARALEAQVIHQDRLASIGQLAAGLAHELGNPLTGITCVAQNLRADLPDDDTRTRLSQILDLAHRIDAIVRNLLSFSRAGVERSPGALDRVVLGEAVREAIDLVHIAPHHRQIQMLNRCGDDITLEADRQRLVQVLVNLLANACDASPPGGLVEVSSARADGRVRIFVCDHGSGMSAEVRARVFEPFFTTKDPGQGTGLGLSLVYNIVRDHGGDVALESTPGAGTRVTVELPEKSA
jgi:Na+/proline symporter/signal transduction histidine kinase